MTAYVILKSFNEVLYKVEGWSNSYYISRIYYDNYIKNNPDALFVSYDYKSTIQLYSYIMNDTASNIDEFLDNQLAMKSSIDEKLHAIYKVVYKHLLSVDSIDDYVFANLVETIGQLALATAPLHPYLRMGNETSEIDILGIMFSMYMQCTISKVNVNIDIVRLWHYILSSDHIVRISKVKYIPVDTIFINT